MLWFIDVSRERRNKLQPLDTQTNNKKIAMGDFFVVVSCQFLLSSCLLVRSCLVRLVFSCPVLFCSHVSPLTQDPQIPAIVFPVSLIVHPVLIVSTSAPLLLMCNVRVSPLSFDRSSCVKCSGFVTCQVIIIDPVCFCVFSLCLTVKPFCLLPAFCLGAVSFPQF